MVKGRDKPLLPSESAGCRCRVSAGAGAYEAAAAGRVSVGRWDWALGVGVRSESTGCPLGVRRESVVGFRTPAPDTPLWEKSME